MKCKHCGMPMVIETQHAYETVWYCKNPDCPEYFIKVYDHTPNFPQPPFYNNETQHYKETLIDQENQRDED